MKSSCRVAYAPGLAQYRAETRSGRREHEKQGKLPFTEAQRSPLRVLGSLVERFRSSHRAKPKTHLSRVYDTHSALYFTGVHMPHMYSMYVMCE